MKKQAMNHIRYQAIFSLLAAWVLLLPQAAFAASTGTTAIYRQIGSGAQTASGDYISSNQGAGLDLTYRYYIEVPAGTANLTVEIWDKDIGAVSIILTGRSAAATTLTVATGSTTRPVVLLPQLLLQLLRWETAFGLNFLASPTLLPVIGNCGSICLRIGLQATMSMVTAYAPMTAILVRAALSSIFMRILSFRLA
jgi:hypothetical protein